MENLNLYYTSSPSLNISALVESPDTYQARTLLLDYLEREGVINRNQRSIYRKQILTKKVDPFSNITSALYLSYIPGEPKFSPSSSSLDSNEVLSEDLPVVETPLPGSAPSVPLQQSNVSPLVRVSLTGKL